MFKNFSFPFFSALVITLTKKYKLIVLLFLVVLGLSLGLAKITPQQGLRGEFFDNDSWAGPAVTSEIDKNIHFQRSYMSKAAGYTEQYSVIWKGFFFGPNDARYYFSVNSDDGSWVYVDDNLLIDNGDQHGPVKKDITVLLPRGNHKVEVRYFDAGGDGLIDFSAQRSGARSKKMLPFPVYSNPITGSQYRMSRILTDVNFCLIFLLILTGTAALFLTIRKIFGPIDFFALLVLGLFLILAFRYESELFLKKSTSVKGCDSYAYLQGAVLMARNGLFHTEFNDPLVSQIYQNYKIKLNDDMAQFVLAPHGYFVYNLRRGLVYNVFPPGMFFLLLPFVKIGGIASAFYVLPILNLIFLVLFFYVGTKCVDIYFGISLSAIVFFNRHVFENTVFIMSDLPSLIFLAGSMFLLYLNIKTAKRYFVVLAGAVFGFAAMLRYPNLAGVFPLLYVFWLKFRRNPSVKEIVKDGLSFGAAFLLFGFLPHALYSHHLFGTFFRLVFEPITGSKTSLANIPGGVMFYATALVHHCGWLGIGVILLGLGAVFVDLRKRPVGILALIFFFSFFISYAAESIRHERYLMPTLPILGVLYGFGVLALVHKFNKIKLLKFLVVAALAVYPFVHSVGSYTTGNLTEEKTSYKLEKEVEKNAVVFCDVMSGSLRLYSNLETFRHNWTQGFVLGDTVRVLSSLHIPVYFFLDSPAADDCFQGLIKDGHLEPNKVHLIGKVNQIPLYRYGPD